MPSVDCQKECNSRISLYFLPFEQKNELSESLFDSFALQWLSDDEWTKVRRYRAENIQFNALQVRLALRGILSLHADIAPADWQFELGEHGKPKLSQTQQDDTQLDFNLSHSGDWLLVGVINKANQADNRLNNVWFGVDIEHLRANTHIQPILNHYFAPTEVAALCDLPSDKQRDRFFDLWALKESYIKASGKGLALSLKSFGFSFNRTISQPLNIKAWGDSAASELSRSEVATDLIILPPNASIAKVDLEIYKAFEESAADSLWLSYLGHVNDEYRFALTLGIAGRDFVAGKDAVDDSEPAALSNISAHFMRLSTLLSC